MTPKSAPVPGSYAWRNMVDYRLKLGYGVEDIAVQLCCTVKRVREHVSELRESGTLAKWYQKVDA